MNELIEGQGVKINNHSQKSNIVTSPAIAILAPPFRPHSWHLYPYRSFPLSAKYISIKKTLDARD